MYCKCFSLKICLYCPLQCYCNFTQVNTEDFHDGSEIFCVSKNHFVALMLE